MEMELEGLSVEVEEVEEGERGRVAMEYIRECARFAVMPQLDDVGGGDVLRVPSTSADADMCEFFLVESGSGSGGIQWSGNQILYELNAENREPGRWVSVQGGVWRECNFPRVSAEWVRVARMDLVRERGKMEMELEGLSDEVSMERMRKRIGRLRKLEQALKSDSALNRALSAMRKITSRERDIFDQLGLVVGHPPLLGNATDELIQVRVDIGLEDPANVYEVGSGILRAARKEDYATRYLSVPLLRENVPPSGIRALDLSVEGSDAERWVEERCPAIWTFLLQVSSYNVGSDQRGVQVADVETAACLVETAGLALIGTMQGWFTVLIGSGRNGKGIYTQMISNIAGRLSYSSRELLAWQRTLGHSERKAQLRGKRFVLVDEPDPRLNMEVLKELTGGAPVSASHKGQKEFMFRPECHIIVNTNKALNLGEPNKAVQQRMLAIPFEATYSAESETHRPRPREEILAEMEPELPAFAMLALTCAREAIRSQRRLVSERVRERTKRMLTEINLAAQWLEECCVLEEGEFVKNESLHKSYKEWCKDLSKRPRALREFLGELKKVARVQGLRVRFQERAPTGDRKMGVRGIRLLAREESGAMF